MRKLTAYMLAILAICLALNTFIDMFVPIRYIEVSEFINAYWVDYTLIALCLILAIHFGE